MPQPAHAGEPPSVRSRPRGLRTQLLVGLSLLILVASLLVGAISVFTMRQQVAEVELQNARLLGHTLAAVLAITIQGGQRQEAALQRAVAGVARSPSVRSIEVVDAQMQLLVGSSDGQSPLQASADLAAALNTRQQVVRIPEGQSGTLAVSTPIASRGRLWGGVRLQLLVGPDDFGWPRLFWLLMLIDGGVLVLFVAMVVSRYVIRPVEAMQRAAARVAQGELDTRLVEEGAYELSSLAGSFNAMTASVKEQLERLERQGRELAASREVLIRSEKLASVGRLAAGVAHEVGNPLQSIIGFTDLLLDGNLRPEEHRDFLVRIGRETQRIHQIIRQLLDYARPQGGDCEAVDLGAVVQQALDLVGPQKRLKDVQVLCADLRSLPRVVGNGPRLVQVLVNLLLNAADAMDGRGQIRIVGLAAPDQPVELCISNTGPLIPEADRPRIFDPFFSTKEPGKGTGLGLAVAQSIVESYGGRLELCEKYPETTFCITLPIFKQSA